jgi:hypothetical protein
MRNANESTRGWGHQRGCPFAHLPRRRRAQGPVKEEKVTVHKVVLDDLFSDPDRPVNPYTGK